MRSLSYASAINEATWQAMELCPQVVVMGQMVDSPAGVFGTTRGLAERFGASRVQDFPVAEGLMTSTAIGAAVAGLRPVVVHHRVDFMLYAMDAITNWLALWRFKCRGQASLPVTIRAVVGRGWGQGPQHSKNLHAWFAHLPGLQVAVPATPYDAKGLLLESLLGDNPTLILEHRSLFSMVEDVPEIPYRVRFGKARIHRHGKDLTLAAIGMFVPLALQAAAVLTEQGIDVEVIDPRTISPLDTAGILESVARTGRLAVLDPAWRTGGFASEIITTVCEHGGSCLRQPPLRLTLPDSHTPAAASLERAYYPEVADVVAQIRGLFPSARVAA